MLTMSRYAFSLFDIAIQALPPKVRGKFVTNSAIIKLLVGNGGLRCGGERIKAAGFEGKWTASVEATPPGETELVAQLMNSLALMKREQDGFPSAYIPAHEWRCLLEDQWKRPLQYTRDHDVAKMASFLRNFFRNEGLSGFWGQSNMFEQFQLKDSLWDLRGEYVMYLEMEVLNEFLPDWDVADLAAPEVGNPWGYKVRGSLLYEPVFTYFLQAEYINRLVQCAARPVVLEIGGGFGGLASHLLKRNPSLRYVGLDLPENVVIQSYYLSCVFPELKVYVHNEDFISLDSAMLESYDVVLLPNYCLPKVQAGVIDMLVNVRSLSEMSKETIAEYFEQIDRIKPAYFFHENIFKDRGDGLHGIPSSKFPALKNYRLVHSGPSRWVRYGADSIYPCHENLFQCNDKLAF